MRNPVDMGLMNAPMSIYLEPASPNNKRARADLQFSHRVKDSMTIPLDLI